MGLLDDMAKEIRESIQKPEGWMTVAEFADLSGMSSKGAEARLNAAVREGRLIKRAWRDGGRIKTIYGEPTKKRAR